MLQVLHSGAGQNCNGHTRRTALKAGVLSFGGLSLAGLQKLRAEGKAAKNEKSVILIWLDGGLSQLESYDPKPDAAVEYRGPFGAISTKVPGITLSELLPRHAALADKMAFVRSLHHGTGDHFAAAHWMLTGRFGSTTASQAPKFPSVGSYVSKMRGANKAGMPAYVGLPAAESVYLFPGYQGAAYLGSEYNPFDVDTEQKYLHFSYNVQIGRPKFLASMQQQVPERMTSRQSLLSSLDSMRRDLDRSGRMRAMDRYQQDALGMVIGPEAQAAFDLEKEDPKNAERYGKNPWGRYTLMARRLVEAGVTFVTVDMPHWDDHSNIAVGHGGKVPIVDQAVGALVEDLSERGLLDQVLVVVMTEFGRTPRINSGQPGIPIPGRDHWGDAISVMLAGGGLAKGIVVGATNGQAAFPIERPLGPHDLLATIYRVMGIDWTQSFLDYSGRPVPILSEGEPIRELFT